jgi:hypothetical protein
LWKLEGIEFGKLVSDGTIRVDHEAHLELLGDLIFFERFDGVVRKVNGMLESVVGVSSLFEKCKIGGK